jgi:hypothetical protein
LPLWHFGIKYLWENADRQRIKEVPMVAASQTSQAGKVPSEVRADSAGRVGLGKALGGRLFQARSQPDGSILLVPARVIPEREVWLPENPKRLAALDAAMADANAGKTSAVTLDDLVDL